MIIKSKDPKTYENFLKYIPIPDPLSHKGQNGKVIIIGGSSLFHASSIWAAEMASHLVDMVHYASTYENEEILLASKKHFRNGIVVKQEQIPQYVEEDDAILIGPGMVRGKIRNPKSEIRNFDDILKIENEPDFTYYLTKYLLENYPEKKYVIDAGSLQMMDKKWLLNLKTPPIITPHQKEFETLFSKNISDMKENEKVKIVLDYAKQYHSVILLKAIKDFVSDGHDSYVIEGGNAGLTKGGTGDILAGLCVSLFAKNKPLEAAVLSAIIIKKAADRLFKAMSYWYNTDNLISIIPEVLTDLI